MSEHSFTIHKINGYISSLYMVENKDGFFLLDAGCSCDFWEVKAFLEKQGKGLKDLKLVVVTHMHPDHSGAVKHFKREGIPIASTEGARKWYRGIGGFLQHKVDTYLARFSAKRKGSSIKPVGYWRKFDPDIMLSDGQSLPFFDDWKVIFTPGHTLYDISLYNEKEKIIYIADVVLKIDEKFVLPFPVVFPEIMKKTLEKIANLDLKKVLLAHGGEVDVETENFKQVLLDLRENVDGKIRPEFRIFYPFCILIHDKWLCKFKQCD